MMTAKECRAKAADALMRAGEATSADVRSICESHAREWTAMALTADLQDELEASLVKSTGANDDAKF